MDLLAGLLFLFAFGYCSCSDEDFMVRMVNTSTFDDNVASSRIIGGFPTSIQDYPFAVQVIRSNTLTCGGSLLTRRTVLSAAHCFIDTNGIAISTRNFQIRAGTANNNVGGTTKSVSRIVTHPRYNTPARDNDIAILLLSSAFTLSSTINVAWIPSLNFNVPDNAYVTYIGWGTINVQTQQVSSVLRQVQVRKVKHTVCAQRYRQLENAVGVPFPVTQSMICAGLLDIGGADACQGDSGGPLIYSPDIVVGVIAWGWECANRTYPGVNARVASYSDWINATVVSLSGGGKSVGESKVVLLMSSVLTMLLTVVFK